MLYEISDYLLASITFGNMLPDSVLKSPYKHNDCSANAACNDDSLTLNTTAAMYDKVKINTCGNYRIRLELL
jgi:hypothetical protein